MHPLRLITIVGSIGFASLAFCQNDFRIDVEGGFAYQTRNTCSVPADGSKFSYRDLLGRGPTNFERLTVLIHPENNSGYRLVIAPLAVNGTGRLSAATNFNGLNFAPGVDTYGRYQFNNYRFSWWHKWKPIGDIKIRAGWTFFVRDADVALAQGPQSSSYYNLGVAPLYYLLAERDFGDRLSAEFEADALAAPQGSALDFGLAVGYKLNSTTKLKLKARYLDGGTGAGSVYNFATFNYISLGLEFRI